MKVYYTVTRQGIEGGTSDQRRHIVLHAANSVKRVEAVDPVAPCCGDMDTAWGRIIDFGRREALGSTLNNQSAEVHLLLFRRNHRGEAVCENIPISFCPFCGDKIETVEVARAP